MQVSIGIMAYNEEANIAQLLQSIQKQKLNTVSIKEIIVVSSGSTDNTNKIVKDLSKKNKKIKLILEKERKGKYSAINKFLKKASARVCILCSSDLRLEKDTIEQLCLPLLDSKIGIVGARPIPLNPQQGYLGYAVNLLWNLHHEIAKRNPKFGELIAFRKVFDKIDKTAVDEEEIAMKIINNYEFIPAYASKSIVYNKGPETIKDFVKQRRRIYAGHLELKKKTGYASSTMVKSKIFNALIKSKAISILNLDRLLFATFLEAYSRGLGWWDLNIKKKKHYVWDIARSTK